MQSFTLEILDPVVYSDYKQQRYPEVNEASRNIVRARLIYAFFLIV